MVVNDFYHLLSLWGLLQIIIRHSCDVPQSTNAFKRFGIICCPSAAGFGAFATFGDDCFSAGGSKNLQPRCLRPVVSATSWLPWWFRHPGPVCAWWLYWSSRGSSPIHSPYGSLFAAGSTKRTPHKIPWCLILLISSTDSGFPVLSRPSFDRLLHLQCLGLGSCQGAIASVQCAETETFLPFNWQTTYDLTCWSCWFTVKACTNCVGWRCVLIT